MYLSDLTGTLATLFSVPRGQVQSDGVIITGTILVARPVGTMVLNSADNLLYRSTNAAAPAYTAVAPPANPRIDTVRILAGGGALAADDTYIEVTATGTFTLDAAPTTGRRIYVKRAYAGLDYTVDGNGKNIDGVATAVLNADGQSIVLIYNGTQWTIN